MKAIRLLVHSNIYISLAAVVLTMATQVQLEMSPQWHPYLFLIFFATLFEYNLHRLITVLTTKDALESSKHNWVKQEKTWFYVLVLFSIVGFLVSVCLAKFKVLLILAPLALLTLFYSTPITKTAQNIFRLREIPYIKIFLIAFVWSSVTILLPMIHSDNSFPILHVFIMWLERFLFLFAITIPFDIRDMESDSKVGLKTIPLKIGEKKSSIAANYSLIMFWIISMIHYSITQQWFLILAFTLSCTSTFFFLSNKKFQSNSLYHYGVLDGTMLFQGILVLFFYFISNF